MQHHKILKQYHVIRCLLLTVMLITSSMMPTSVAYAARGMPDSTEFGYGATLDIWGDEVELSIKSAVAIGLDWVRIDFDWARIWPDPSSSTDFDHLDKVMADLSVHRINVLLSIINAPHWAKTRNGPDIDHTIDLVRNLAQRYPQNLLTIELFPMANTLQGWGAPPDPAAYSALIKASQEALIELGSPILIVAAGLTPLPSDDSPEDMDDIQFLEGLYRAENAASLPILSIRLNGVSEDIMASPDNPDPRVFRHYESLRQVMIKNEHSSGLVWITGFTWPATNMDLSGQERWLIQALTLTKSQLYLGVAFFDRLNPAAGSTNDLSNSLILTDAGSTHLHPGLGTLGQIISISRTGQKSSLHNFLYKKMIAGPKKNYLKTTMP